MLIIGCDFHTRYQQIAESFEHLLQRSRRSRFHINSVVVKLMPSFVAILRTSRTAPTRSLASNPFRAAQMFLLRTQSTPRNLCAYFRTGIRFENPLG
jgi:hypothetical protein